MAFLKWPDKDPNEILDYQVRWTSRLGSDDTIASSTWILPDGTLEKQSDSFTDTTTTIWLMLGTIGTSYTLTNRVVTAGGRTWDQSIRIKIKER